jgi:prevent-host-death family protein
MTATEASRNFSELLNRVAAGERVEITRSGRAVAVIAPPDEPPTAKRFLSSEELRDLFDSLEPFDKDFVRDLEEIRRSTGTLPLESPWDT